MNRREFLASLFAAPVALAAAPLVISAGSKISVSFTGNPDVLALLNEYTMKFIVPKTTDMIFQDRCQWVVGPYRKPTDGSAKWSRRFGGGKFVLNPLRLPT